MNTSDLPYSASPLSPLTDPDQVLQALVPWLQKNHEAVYLKQFSRWSFLVHVVYKRSELLKLHINLFNHPPSSSSPPSLHLGLNRARGCVISYCALLNETRGFLNATFHLALPFYPDISPFFPTWEGVKFSEEEVGRLVEFVHSDDARVRRQGWRALACGTAASEGNRGKVLERWKELFVLAREEEKRGDRGDEEGQFWSRRLIDEVMGVEIVRMGGEK